MKPPELQFYFYFAPFDCVTWILLMTTVLGVFGLARFHTPSQIGAFELLISFIAPLMEICYPIKVKKNLQNGQTIMGYMVFIRDSRS